MAIRICHVASNHSVTDARIFKKECKSLSKEYDVSLIVPNTDTNTVDGIHVVGVSLPESRLRRMVSLSPVYKAAIKVDADIYHFHDPELLPIARKIKKRGKKVIYDSHEDMPSDILEKPYLPKWSRKIISLLYERYEKRTLNLFDALVTVSPKIVERLSKINPNTYLVTNYPIYREIPDNNNREKQICFTGLISHIWNHAPIIKALKKTGVRYILAGPITDQYMNELSKEDGWEYVDYKGVVAPSEVEVIQTHSIAGMAVLGYSPIAGGKEGTLGNTKLFEYMMSGTPVVATDMRLWKNIIDKYNCGICVNPDSSDEIANAITRLLEDPNLVITMGKNGKEAVRKEFNWETQEQVLLDMYSNIIKV